MMMRNHISIPRETRGPALSYRLHAGCTLQGFNRSWTLSGCGVYIVTFVECDVHRWESSIHEFLTGKVSGEKSSGRKGCVVMEYVRGWGKKVDSRDSVATVLAPSSHHPIAYTKTYKGCREKRESPHPHNSTRHLISPYAHQVFKSTQDEGRHTSFSLHL